MLNFHLRPSRLPLFLATVLLLVLFWYQGLPRVHNYFFYNGFRYRKSSFDWSKVEQAHPVDSIRQLPTYLPEQLPRVQHDFHTGKSSNKDVLGSRRREVLDAFTKSWDSYKERAWMYDELRPVSGNGRMAFGGFAATLIDSLDTLWIMGLHDDFRHAVQAVAILDWANTTDTSVNMFETTIRHLGGLLGAYDLSQEPVLLAKAIELGNMLYAGFDTPNRMPRFWFVFEDAKTGKQVAEDHQSSAAGTSLSMEFTRLSQLTGNSKYFDATDRVKGFLYKNRYETKLPGMWPMYLDYRSERADDNVFTLGAQADSLYEYLPKMHALLGGLDEQYVDMSKGALDAIKKHLLFRPMTSNKADILFSGNAIARNPRDVELAPEGQHLGCFVAGMYGLAGKLLEREDYVDIGEKIAQGCAWAYKAFPTGIMPEIFNLIPCTTPDLGPCEWDEERWQKEGDKTLEKGFRNARDPRYLLRPEAIESLFYMYRITGKEEYQEMAWTMFQAIRKATETELAFSSIFSVTTAGETSKLDSMEVSFPSLFLSESAGQDSP
jgi:mannosyl-oligosaccharide alpha-1,2-mannosidase